MASVLKSRKKKYVWLIITAALALAIVLTIVSLPYLAKYVARTQLIQMGAQQVDIGSIRFELFDGIIQVNEFAMQGQASGSTTTRQNFVKIASIKLDLSLRELFNKKIVIEDFLLNGGNVFIEELAPGRFNIGIPIPIEKTKNAEASGSSAAPSTFDWGIGLSNLSLKNVVIDLRSKNLNCDANITSLTIDRFNTWSPTKPSQLQLSAIFNKSPLTLSIVSNPLAAEPKAKINITVDQLKLSTFNAYLPNNITNFESLLSLDLKSDLLLQNNNDNKTVNTELSGTIKLDNSQVSNDQFQLHHLNTQWQGQLSALTELTSSDTIINQKSVLLFEKLDISLTQHPNRITSDSINIENVTNLNSADINNSLKVTGNMTINGLVSRLLAIADANQSGKGDSKSANLKTPNAQFQLMKLDQLKLTSLAITGLNQSSIATLDLKGLSLLQDLRENSTLNTDDKPTLISNADVHVDNIELDDRSKLSVKSVAISQLNANLTINKAGKLQVLDDVISTLELLDDSSKEAQTSTPDTSAPGSVAGATQNPVPSDTKIADVDTTPDFQFRLNQFSVGEPSKIQFADFSIKPEFSTQVSIDTFNLGPIDSSASTLKTQLNLTAKVGEYADLVATGDLQLFSAKKSGYLKANITSLELPPVSPYASKLIGYSLESGQLNSTMSISINNDILKGKNKVVIANLTIEPHDKKRIKQFAKKISMPLDLALSLMKNKKGDVKINIPIKGDINNPQIKLAEVISRAVAKAIKNGSLTYLKFALQPYGAGIMLAQRLSEIRLAAIEFSPNSAELEKDDLDYISKIATVMNKRPGLRIRLCSISTDADKLALEVNPAVKSTSSGEERSLTNIATLDEKILELGTLRSVTIKNQLIDQFKLAPDRLFVCRAAYEEGKSKAPRTELKL